MTNRTVLFDKHVEYKGKIVDFAGWEMPVNYGSQIDEHHQVRKDAGMFDVSHMVVVDLKGAGVRDFLRHLLANDVAKLREPGRALYSCMLNLAGGEHVEDINRLREQQQELEAQARLTAEHATELQRVTAARDEHAQNAEQLRARLRELGADPRAVVAWAARSCGLDVSERCTAREASRPAMTWLVVLPTSETRRP